MQVAKTGSLPRDPTLLANRFYILLKRELTRKDFEEMLRLNATKDYDSSGSCASHDFCDANMVMEEAWRDLGYGEVNPESQADADLWNDAWNIAKREYLTKK